jgi:hypothetical protein
VTQIATWSQGDNSYAVITDVAGKIIYNYAQLGDFPPQTIEFSALPVAIKSIHAVEFSDYGSTYRIEGGVTCKAMLLVTMSGELLCAGNIDFLGLLPTSPKYRGTALAKIMTPPNACINHVATFENGLVLITTEGDIWLNRAAMMRQQYESLSQSHEFHLIKGPTTKIKLSKKAAPVLAVLGSDFLLIQTRADVVYGRTIIPPETTQLVTTRVPHQVDCLNSSGHFPKAKEWFRMDCYKWTTESRNQESLIITQIASTTVDSHFWADKQANYCVYAKSKSDLVFNLSSRRQMKDVVSPVILARQDKVYWVQANKLCWRSHRYSADGAPSGDVSYLGGYVTLDHDLSEVIELAHCMVADSTGKMRDKFLLLVQNEDSNTLQIQRKLYEVMVQGPLPVAPGLPGALQLALEQRQVGTMSSATRPIAHRLPPYKVRSHDQGYQAEVQFGPDYPVVSSYCLLLKEMQSLSKTHRIALWSDGSFAVSLGNKILVETQDGFLTTAQDPSSPRKKHYLSAPFDPILTPNMSFSKAQKIFAAENPRGKALFVWTGKYLIACGALAYYQLVDLQGQMIVENSQQFVGIGLPEGVVLQELAVKDNMVVVLTVNNNLWFSRGAFYRYGLGEDELSENQFIGRSLPELPMKTPATQRERMTHAKLILDETSFYVLLQEGHIICYCAPTSSGQKGQWHMVRFGTGLLFFTRQQIRDMQLSLDVETKTACLTFLGRNKRVYQMLHRKGHKEQRVPVAGEINKRSVTFIVCDPKTPTIIYGRKDNSIWLSQPAEGGRGRVDMQIAGGRPDVAEYKIVDAGFNGSRFLNLYQDPSNQQVLLLDCSSDAGKRLIPRDFPLLPRDLADCLSVPAIKTPVYRETQAAPVAAPAEMAEAFSAMQLSCQDDGDESDEYEDEWDEDEDETSVSVAAAESSAGSGRDVTYDQLTEAGLIRPGASRRGEGLRNFESRRSVRSFAS